MAQRKLTWTELRVGVFVLAGLIILSLGVFYVTGSNAMFTPKNRIVTYLPDVGTLQDGAPVRLDGVDIGNVDSVQLNPNPKNRLQSIRVGLTISRKYMLYLRVGSTAHLETEGLLGNSYVAVSRSLTGPQIPPGGEIPGEAASSIKEVAERGVELEDNLGALSNQVQAIVNDVQKGRGTIGKLLEDPTLYNHLNATVADTQQMIADARNGKGSLGKLVASDELYNKADSAVGHVNNIAAAVEEQKGTLGKLVYDPAVYQSTKQFMDKSNALLSDIREGKGTLGKLATDEALYNNVRDASAKLRDVSAKLDQNEGTMGKFVNDPQFYDNVTGLTGDMRLLIGDFRRNPKKFLHIKLGVF
jgi:phospholipid/cholesterol/gamma-HCH transport system substrate-binding protein